MIRIKNTFVRAEDVVSIGIKPYGQSSDKKFSVTVEISHPKMGLYPLTIENITENMADIYSKDWATEIHAQLVELKK